MSIILEKKNISLYKGLSSEVFVQYEETAGGLSVTLFGENIKQSKYLNVTGDREAAQGSNQLCYSAKIILVEVESRVMRN